VTAEHLTQGQESALDGCFVLPCSFGQRRLWFLNELDPDSAGAYAGHGAVRLRGRLDTGVLRHALALVAHRHETLRTGLAVLDGEPVQAVRPDLELPLETVDVSTAPDPEAALREAVRTAAARPFDLTRPPLARVTLFRAGPGDHALLVSFHHAVSDLWSGTVFFRELAGHYAALAAGATPQPPPLPVQYGDYAAWQTEWLDSPGQARQLSYWREHLAGLPVLDLPADHPRPPVQTYRGATTTLDLPAGLVRALDTLARRQGATRYMVLLAAFAALLSRYSGQHDIAVGSPFAGRGRPELENLIGFFVNNLVLRTDLSGQPTFTELLARVRETCLDAYAHPDVPFERLVEELRPPRDLSRSPLFQVVLMLANVPLADLEFAGLDVEPLEVPTGTAKFDLFLTVTPHGDGLRAALEYNTDLFEAATARRMLEHLRTLLAEAAAAPGRPVDALPLLSAEERALLAEWGQGPAAPPAPLLPRRVEEQARRHPDRVAVTLPDGSAALTYRELHERAGRLARRLRGLGLTTGGLVGVCMERTPGLVAALLGVLRAGGAYLPIDPALPADRVRFMLEDSAAPVLLTEKHLLEGLPDHPGHVLCLDGDDWPTGDEDAGDEHVGDASAGDACADGPGPAAGDLAYVLYTSGSTGRPKGVMVEHGALANFLASMAAEPGLAGHDVLAAVTTLSFDIAALELWLPLTTGARVVLLSRDDAADGARLARRLAGCGATVMQATPATWQLLCEAGWRPQRPFTALCGGEALPAELARDLAATGAQVWNLYGPTETTIWSTLHPVRGTEDPVPLGRPLAETRLHVVDAAGRPTPIGVPGELVIGGAGVARGYLGRPELTAERFVADPLDPARRAYRTGDLVRYRNDGTLEYLGRTDFQVKIRGFRIEPGEIEAVLRGHPGVREAVVVAREDRPGDRRLVAYVVPRENAPRQTPDGPALVRELRELVLARLPEYMVPARTVLLEAMPLTPNGKTDRTALPAPDADLAGEGYTAPRTPVEEELARIFAATLGLARVGVHDDFFAIGGHSLLATRVLAGVTRAWGVDLPVRALFQRPTVARLAQVIDAGGDLDAAAEPAPDLRAEITLDPQITPGGPRTPAGPPEHVVFTGATGFLGAFLLERVLHETPATVHCLVRARSDEEAQRRLTARLREFGVWDERTMHGRVRAFAGDLAAPRLGLTEDAFRRLADEAGEIYHVGANVNFLRPYRALAPGNVGGTREVLRLAATGPVTPVHHVSTFSVLPMHRDGEPPWHESDLPETPPPAENGYNQSKWVAEHVVALARDRGLPVAVYRPGRVAGHSGTGHWNTEDITARVFRACAEIGMVPEVDIRADMLPVDYVAAAIGRLARHPDAPGRTFHFRGPRPFPLPRIAGVLDSLGYPVRLVPFERWLAACRAHAAEHPDSDLGPTASLFGFRVEQHEQGLRDPHVDASATERLLAGAVRCPEVDDDLMRRYLRRMAATGFLPAPGVTTREGC
jgi:myxalamid-type nonribosomal peptide synthetase MxaA